MEQTSPNELLDDGIIQISIHDGEDDFHIVTPNGPKFNYYQSLIRDDTHGRPSGIKRSSFNLEDSYNNSSEHKVPSESGDSFSGLNGSIREETFKSKLGKNARSEIREDTPTEKEMYEFNQSIFTDRYSGQLVGLNRRSQEKQGEKEDKEEGNLVGGSSSIEMKSTSEASELVPPAQRESQVKLLLRSTDYFLELPTQESVMVTGEMLRDLYDQFFSLEIFIPLFKYERFDEWKRAADRFNPYLQAHRIFKVSLQRYVDYVVAAHPKEFYTVFKQLEEIQRGKANRRRKEQASFFNIDIAAIVDSVRHYLSSSKAELLRETLLAKIRAVQEVLRMSGGEVQLTNQTQLLQARVEELWKYIGEVELLVNFESTEQYCGKKIEDSPEPKFKEIWIKYREKMREEKTQHADAYLRSLLI